MMRRLALSLVSLLLALLLAELALRAAGVRTPDWTRPDPWLGWSLRPGADYDFVAAEPCPGWGSKGRINSRGLRDREFVVPKPPDTFRILALGDSYTEAMQLPLEQSWTKQLEARLNGTTGVPAPGVRFEVINAGRSGMGTAHELLFYQHEGRRYGADLVLLLFVRNDFEDNSAALAGPADIGPYFHLQGDTLALDLGFRQQRGYKLRQWLAPLRSHSRLLSWAMHAVTVAKTRRASARADARAGAAPAAAVPAGTAGSGGAAARLGTVVPTRTGPRPYELWLAEPSAPWQEAIEITRRLLAALHAEVRADGAPLVVVGATSRVQVQPEWIARAHEEHPEWLLDRPAVHAAEACIAAGIPFFDLVPTFRTHASAQPVFLHGCAENDADGHWSPAGHALAAAQIASFLQQSGLIPGSSLSSPTPSDPAEDSDAVPPPPAAASNRQ